jgi:hypothetical protein
MAVALRAFGCCFIRDNCRSCKYPPPTISPPFSSVCARLVPSSLLFFSYVFFFFCFLNSNSGADSFSSSYSLASASFYFMCFDKESRPRKAPQVERGMGATLLLPFQIRYKLVPKKLDPRPLSKTLHTHTHPETKTQRKCIFLCWVTNNNYLL